MTYPGLSMWNGSSKTHYFIDFGTLSLGGCGGHPMRPKLNLKDKSQMSTPNEYTDNFKSNSTCTFSFCQDQIKKNTLPSDTVYGPFEQSNMNCRLDFCP
jgi:hypothetical protein